MSRTLLITVLILVATPSFAIDEKNITLYASAGFGIPLLRLDDRHHNSIGFGPSIFTFATYGITPKIELGIYSIINGGIMENAETIAQGSFIRGNFWYKSVAFGPILKYNTEYIPFHEWSLYWMLAPHFEMLTMTPYNEANVDGGDYNGKRPIKYEGRGGILGLGISSSKKSSTEKNVIYYQIIFKYMHIDELSIMSRSTIDTEVLHSEKMQTSMHLYGVSCHVGLALF